MTCLSLNAICGNCAYFREEDFAVIGRCEKTDRCIAVKHFCEEWEPDLSKLRELNRSNGNRKERSENN